MVKELLIEIFHKLICFFSPHVLRDDFSIVLSIFLDAIANDLLGSADLSQPLLLLLLLILIDFCLQLILNSEVFGWQFDADK